MRDYKRIRGRLQEARYFMLFVGIAWIFATAMLVGNLSKIVGGENGITAMVTSGKGKYVAQSTVDFASSTSSLIYFAGFVLFGGVLFAVSRYSTELRTILQTESRKEHFTTTPKTAMGDFLQILINWSSKYATSTKSVLDVMQQIKRDNKSRVVVLKEIDFKLSEDESDIVITVGAVEWEDLYVVFKTFLKELDVNEERFIHIAEYMGKSDVALVLRKVGQISDLIVREVEGKSKK